MFRIRRRLLACGAVLLAVPLACATGATAYAAATTGGITGHLNTDGHARLDVSVTLFDSQQNWLDSQHVDGTGAFDFTNLRPGQYELQFDYSNGLEQWYHLKPPGGQPDLVAVVAGSDTVVEETTLPTGTISGTLVDDAGTPVAGATVRPSPESGSSFPSGTTDAAGHYSIAVLPGVYVMSFQPAGYAEEYAPQTLDEPRAARFTVTAGATVTVNERLLATGSMSGRYFTAQGLPAANVAVGAADPNGGGYVSTQTDANGNYALPHVYVGTYTVSFNDYATNQSQYAYRSAYPSTATTFAVTKGGNTVVNDSELPTGSLRITASDQLTGKSVTGFCAYAGNQQACSDSTGVALLTGVQQGTQPLYIQDNDSRYVHLVTQVKVVGRQTTQVVARLAPGAFIDVTVKDHATGAVLPNVGVVNVAADPSVVLPGNTGYQSDAQGHVHIGPLAAGTYDLYAWGGNSGYGDQWVGASGGTGLKAQAAQVTVAAGQTVSGPTVLLDHAGTITGTVTDAVTNQPVANAFVMNSAYPFGPGPGGRVAQTDGLGHYTLTELGPYAWPLFFTSDNLPFQWSGGVADNRTATTVTVPANGTVTYNQALVSGITVSGTVHGTSGAVPRGARITAFNATGDPLAAVEVNDDGTYQLTVLGSQTIKVYVEADAAQPHGWYGGADFAHATPVTLGTQNQTLNITTG